MIGKWKIERAGGYDPENPQPDPTLEPVASRAAAAVDRSRSYPDVAPALTTTDAVASTPREDADHG